MIFMIFAFWAIFGQLEIFCLSVSLILLRKNPNYWSGNPRLRLVPRDAFFLCFATLALPPSPSLQVYTPGQHYLLVWCKNSTKSCYLSLKSDHLKRCFIEWIMYIWVDWSLCAYFHYWNHACLLLQESWINVMLAQPCSNICWTKLLLLFNFQLKDKIPVIFKMVL